MGVWFVWVRRNYGYRWMPGLITMWRVTPTRTGPRWDALVFVADRDRHWFEWHGFDELEPVRVKPPAGFEEHPPVLRIMDFPHNP
jgi:hypothetical protein